VITQQVLQGDCRQILKTLADNSVHCIVTSPPYWNQRDYGVVGQIGLEATPAEYVQVMVEVFREVRRVLRPDGTLWLNLGDTYCNDLKWGGSSGGKNLLKKAEGKHNYAVGTPGGFPATRQRKVVGLPSKSLIGIPWRVAFALQEDGWILRQDIIWHKRNPMPESVTDRPTKAHEYIFLFSKSGKYYYDAEAIKEPVTGNAHSRGKGKNPKRMAADRYVRSNATFDTTIMYETRNKRSVWTVATQAYSEAHYATFPEKLIEPCILAGCPEGGTVLDPFGGSGTVGQVATRFNRNSILVELNPEYIGQIEKRTDEVQFCNWVQCEHMIIPTDVELEFHEVANIFPMMNGEEFAALVEDIKTNGLQEAIWLHEMQIVDGRNRYRACQEAGNRATVQGMGRQRITCSFCGFAQFETAALNQ
jgi:DNA modification methylase